MTPDKDQMDYNLTNHRPSATGIEKIERQRNFAKQFAYAVIDNAPDSPEKTMALRKIEEALFWANAAVARAKENQEEIVNHAA